jgi:hypothetical protein
MVNGWTFNGNDHGRIGMASKMGEARRASNWSCCFKSAGVNPTIRSYRHRKGEASSVNGNRVVSPERANNPRFMPKKADPGIAVDVRSLLRNANSSMRSNVHPDSTCTRTERAKALYP